MVFCTMCNILGCQKMYEVKISPSFYIKNDLRRCGTLSPLGFFLADCPFTFFDKQMFDVCYYRFICLRQEW